MSSDVSAVGFDGDLEHRLRDALADRYRLEHVIGAGSSAVVYRAFDVKHRRAVAVKVLRPVVAAHVGGRRFLQEIEVASRLSHPHVLALYDSGEAAGLVYYVTPLIEGGSLRTLLAREGSLRLDDALRIVREVASALQHAHDHGVIHRDVKPENILLTSDTSASLGDFGLARLLLDVPNESLTGQGIAVGTAWYMSPEQASGDTVDARTDQYALACVLYEMLAGDPPFQGRTAQNILARHRADPRPHARAVRESIPIGIDDALVRAMAIHPADRFAAVMDLPKALEAALTSETLASVRRPTPVPNAAGRRGRQRALAGVVVVAVAALGTWQWRGRAAADLPLAADRLAVAPFDMLGLTDTLWRSGMVDMLSRNFDGAGPLRTVTPTAVLRGWHGRADASSAAALARRTGAGLVVLGQLLSSGRDSIKLRATLVDAIADRAMPEIELSDEVAHIPRLADSLTMRMLRQLEGSRAIRIVRGGSVGSASLPALKAFLQGEQQLRQNDYPGAGESYARAVALDSSFALAYRGLRNVRRNANESDSLARVYGRRSASFNKGLAPRDSLLIVADSMAGELPVGFAFFSNRSLALLRRRIATLETAVARYPDDADAWRELAEARLHNGPRVGIHVESALEAFEKAIAADSGFLPAYYHAVELGLSYRDEENVRRLVRGFLGIRPGDGRFRAIGLLLSPSPAQRQQGFLTASRLRADSALDVAWLLRRHRSNPETAVRVFTDMLDPGGNRTVDTATVRLWFTGYLLQLGRLRGAAALADRRFWNLVPMNLTTLGRFGLVAPDTVSNVVREWAAGTNSERLRTAAGWFGWQRDTTSLKALAGRVNGVGAAPGTDSVAALYLRGTVTAHLALARGDSAGALLLFRSLPDSFCSWSCWPDVELTARMLAAQRDFRGAADLLDRHQPPHSATAFIELPWLTLRADLAARLGESSVMTRIQRPLAELTRSADGAWSSAGAPGKQSSSIERSRR